MEINNQFEVPLAPPEAWALLLDVDRIVPSVPGAELLETIDPQTFKGKVAVKLGPIALSFVGTAQFVERDDVAHRAKVKAKGSDAKGRGNANAEVTFHLEPIPEGSRVSVQTNVNLSGSIAQYGRGAGVIQGVASQLTAQFASNLRASLAQRAPQQDTGPAAIADNAPPRSDAGAAPDPAVAIAKPTGLAAPSAAPPAPAAKPISGFALIAKVLWGMIAGRFTGRKS